MPVVSPNILVVNDQLDELRTLSAIFKHQGYRVRKATSGEMALQTIHSCPPDLILLDILMPQMDGFTLCNMLKSSAETCDIPIIFLSILNDATDKVKAFKLGASDYITKPFQSEEVLIRVQHQLMIQSQQRQLQLKRQEWQLLSDVTQWMQQAWQLDAIFKMTVAEVRRLFQVERVLVCHFPLSWNGEVIAESIASDTLSLLEKTVAEPRFREYWRQLSICRRVMAMTHAASDSEDANWLERFQIRASLAAPLVVENRTWGVIVAHQCSAVRGWESWQITFLQQLAAQLTVAIQQAQLCQKVQALSASLKS